MTEFITTHTLGLQISGEKESGHVTMTVNAQYTVISIAVHHSEANSFGGADIGIILEIQRAPQLQELACVNSELFFAQSCALLTKFCGGVSWQSPALEMSTQYKNKKPSHLDVNG